jgi:hypothetical protein
MSKPTLYRFPDGKAFTSVHEFARLYKIAPRKARRILEDRVKRGEMVKLEQQEKQQGKDSK